MKHRNLIAIRVRVRELGLLTTAKRKAILVRKGFSVGRVKFLSEEDVIIEILKIEFNTVTVREWKDSR